MSDMFESLELNMREEADRVNPTKAILATQLECEQRFESFVAKNPERVDFLSDDIRSVADKYAAEYDIPSETIYEATVTHLKEAAVKQADDSMNYRLNDGLSNIIQDYVGYNHDLDGIEHYWNQYKPKVESLLQGNNQGVAYQRQLETEIEHLKNELDGVDSEEEGSERYWALEEEISNALSALYDKGVDQSLEEARESSVREAEWDKPWTEEDESKEEDEEETEEKEEEDEEENEEEEKKESSVREAKECNCWDGYKRVPGTKPCSPGSCEKCDSGREKKKAAFILDNADSLVPEWIQKNAGWREMLRGFMDRNRNDDVGYNAPDWSSKKNPLPAKARKMQEQNGSEYEDMIEDQSRAEEKMKENARKRQEMFESEPEYKTRGKHRYEYLRGASVNALKEFYVAQGIPEKTASILVEAVGEMAQLQTNEPGLPVGSSDPNSIKIDKEIGGAEGDKYKNLDVAQKQKELGLEHQDFTDFGEPVREFVQPGGEAPYSENTKKRIDKAEQDNLNAKGVKQEDNAPKKSSASVKEASDLSLVPPEGVRSAARRGIKYHSEGKAGDGFESATLARAKKIAEGQELTPEHVKRMHSFFERHAGGRSQKAKQGEITPWDVAWLAWGGNAGRTWAASKVKQMENAKKSSAPLDFDMIDNEVEKLMAGGMTPEQAIQSLGVYNNTNEPIGWGGSKN